MTLFKHLKYKIDVFKLLLPVLVFSLFFVSTGVQAKSGSTRPIATVHKHKPQQRHTQAKLTASHSNCILPDPATKNRPSQQVVKEVSVPRLRKKLSSRSAIIMDGKSGEILYSHDPDRPGQPASTVKVLTGLLAIKALDNKDMVSTSRRASRMPRSKIYIKPGTHYKANDLINAVLLASANDASVAIAEKVAGSEKNFARLMTRKARQLGAKKTICKTATGLTARGQQSTVRDLAVVFNEAMKNKEFANRMSRTKIRTSYGKTLRNHNKALWRIKGALGGKTGYTRAARQTYVGAFERGQDELIVAIMGSESMWEDISSLVEYGFSKKQRMARMRKDIKPQTLGKAADPEMALAKLTAKIREESGYILTDVKKHSKL